jgi:hypothetical protein
MSRCPISVLKIYFLCSDYEYEYYRYTPYSNNKYLLHHSIKRQPSIEFPIQCLKKTFPLRQALYGKCEGNHHNRVNISEDSVVPDLYRYLLFISGSNRQKQLLVQISARRNLGLIMGLNLG